jgi:hypothetical protein
MSEPTSPISPKGDQPLPPIQGIPTTPEFEGEALAPFQKFLGPSATKEHVQQFLNTWVKSMLHEIKKGEKKWKESMDRMRRM